MIYHYQYDEAKSRASPRCLPLTIRLGSRNDEPARGAVVHSAIGVSYELMRSKRAEDGLSVFDEIAAVAGKGESKPMVSSVAVKVRAG